MGGGPAQDVLLCTLPWPEPTAVLDFFRQKFPHLEVIYVQIPYSSANASTACGSAASVPAHLWKSATILCTLFTLPPIPEHAPDLKLVHLVSAGSNAIERDPLYTDTDVTITTSSGIHGPQIAEWVVMTGLVASHKYKQLYELQKKRQWGALTGQEDGQNDFRNVKDRVGQRVGVLGYGSIGRQVGRVARAMGMEVYAYTASSKDTAEKRKDKGYIIDGTGDPDGEIPAAWFSGFDKASLHGFLQSDLDWLVISVPLTAQTRHLLSTSEFEKLSHGGKRPAFVTNIARGAILDQSALLAALKDGTLSGAALDVTDPEPLPEDSELWGLDNVIVTPHISGIGSNYVERTFDILQINLERREKGERLLNVVDRERGYQHSN